MTGIVDYNAGNIRSVERAVTALGIDFITSQNPKDLEKADRVIFPGVGDAQYAMDQLKKTGFDSFLKEYAASKSLCSASALAPRSFSTGQKKATHHVLAS